MMMVPAQCMVLQQVGLKVFVIFMTNRVSVNNEIVLDTKIVRREMKTDI